MRLAATGRREEGRGGRIILTEPLKREEFFLVWLLVTGGLRGQGAFHHHRNLLALTDGAFTLELQVFFYCEVFYVWFPVDKGISDV